MSIYLNVFPIARYPNEIEVGILEYSDDNYQKYGGSCYRIGDNLYVYGDRENKIQKVLTKETGGFSLVLQHLILKAFQNSYNKENYRTEEGRKRLTIIRREPNIKTEYVEIFEGIEIQTLHWQDINFGIVVDYLTKNSFTEKFTTEKLKASSLPFPSYSNFYKYLGQEEAKNIMTKIADLRRERALGRMRSDALEQRMLKIKELLRDCLDWKDAQEKELPLPTGNTITVSIKNTEVILLSGKGATYE